MSSSNFIMRVIVALLIASPALALEAGAATNCSSLLTYGDCSPHLHCEWCGATNESYPISACYERGVKLTCCAGSNNVGYFCNPSVDICSPQETCYQDAIVTSYGTCNVPMCCGPNKPTPCSPYCIAADEICCGSGLSCSAGQICCGGEDDGFACCDKDSSCCSAPDGYSHWCCPNSQVCNVNGGCDPDN